MTRYCTSTGTRPRPSAIRTSAILAIAATFLGNAVSAQDVPFAVQGSVRDNGATPPADGLYNMSFRIFDQASGGTQLYVKNFTGANQAQILNGVFSVTLGDTPAFSAGLLDGSTPLFLEIAYDRDDSGTFEAGEVFSPRRGLRAASRAAALTSGDKTIDGALDVSGDLSVAGRIQGDVALAAPLPGSPPANDVNRVEVNVSNVGLGAVRGFQVFARGTDATASGFTHGTVTAFLPNARVTGMGNATAVQPNALYEGTNTDPDPTVMPLMTGVNAVAGLHPSTTSDKAVFAFGGVFTATSDQEGSNVGLAGSARDGTRSNVGVTGSAGLSDAEIGIVTAGVPAGFTAGGYFVNLDPGTSENYAVFAAGDVAIAPASGTFTEAANTTALADPLDLSAVHGNVIFLTGGPGSVTSISAKPAGTRLTLVVAGVASFIDNASGPLFLAGDFVATPGSTLVLVSDGTNWFEVSRSSN